MKFSEIQMLYRQTEVKKLGKEFFIDLYRFCIQSLEKLEDEIITRVFKEASDSNSNITQFSVYKYGKELMIELWKDGIANSAFRANLNRYNQEFDLHGFSMWISLNPEEPKVALGWSKGFTSEDASRIFD